MPKYSPAEKEIPKVINPSCWSIMKSLVNCTVAEFAFTGMSGKKKISEVKAWLDGQVGEYMKKVTKEFNEKWTYPDYEEVTGDSPEATAKHRKRWVLASKFNNECHKATVVVVTNNLVGNPAVLTKKKKLLFNLKPVQWLCAVQIYSQHYFPTCVWPYVNQALKANTQPLGCGAKLNLSNHIMAKEFKAEMDAIKEEILAAMEGVHEEISEVEAKAIDQVPALLQPKWAGGFWSLQGGLFQQTMGIYIPVAFILVKPSMAIIFSTSMLPSLWTQMTQPDAVEVQGGPGALFIEEGTGASSNEGSTAAVAHISTIQGTKRKQHHIEDDDNGVHSEVRVSKHAHKPCSPHGIIATGWLPSALGYLMDPALGSEWQELLVKWQDLEGRMSQVAGCSPGKGCMASQSKVYVRSTSIWEGNRKLGCILSGYEVSESWSWFQSLVPIQEL
ncbi:hypothetical protein EDD18DRAFT_1109230 [Armillaria luteobubalina]|uniref:Uncharacterized protein n=1 Tax=Armillaria luteobubalina TaxID=153913 RepID=A0AA39PY38_9AGAR|nr:hypothetical protein EDD18DRAFT_1109230 [Armillaria luteobubalina]